MESEKVKEIKKALEDNITDHFPYIDGHKCKLLPYATILTLINELESENERLLEQRNKTYNIWAKDTEKLKDRIAELEKENSKLNIELDKRDCIDYPCRLIEKEQLKQFAERVKMEIPDESTLGYLGYNGVMEVIDETLEECLGK